MSDESTTTADPKAQVGDYALVLWGDVQIWIEVMGFVYVPLRLIGYVRSRPVPPGLKHGQSVEVPAEHVRRVVAKPNVNSLIEHDFLAFPGPEPDEEFRRAFDRAAGMVGPGRALGDDERELLEDIHALEARFNGLIDRMKAMGGLGAREIAIAQTEGENAFLRAERAVTQPQRRVA
jgi:hypothetical protein